MAEGTVSVRPIDLLRTSAFRPTAIVIAVLALLAGAGFGGGYHWTIEAVRQYSQQIIAVEAQGLGEHYRLHGLPDLVTVVSTRSKAEDRSLYLLTDRADRKLAGNLARWPQQVDELGVWREFRYPNSHDGETEHEHGARALAFQLPDGVRLLVGYDIEDEIALGSNMLILGAAISALILLAGLTSGLVYTRSLRRRVATIDRAGRGVMEDLLRDREGEEQRLLPVSNPGNEFDDLSRSLNEMLARIADLMRQQRRLTANIDHELGRPLRFLHRQLDSARRAPTVGEAEKKTLDAVVDKVEAMIRTFAVLVRIAKAELDPSTLKPVDLAGIARDAAEYHEFAAEDAGLTLEFRAEGEPPAPRGERELMSLVLDNLIDNAIKYTPSDGAVVVTVDAGGVAVSDTGPGIPAEKRERAQDRFTRLDESGGLPGSGLGLALVAGVARLHKARLVLEDARPGEVPPGLRASLRWSG